MQTLKGATTQLSGGPGGRAMRRRAGIVAFALGLALALPTAPPARGTHVRGHDVNSSIVFYKPTSATTGTARFGTLSEGTLTMKAELATKRWTHAAVSRDTLLFYNSATGNGLTGTFTDGVFTRKGTFTIARGFDQVAASCDSVLFYNRKTGWIFIGHLQGGGFSPLVAGPPFGPGLDLISSSCDTMQLWRNGGNGIYEWGLLQGGRYTKKGHINLSPLTISHRTSTADSYLQYARDYGFGEWGKAQGGTTSSAGSARTFGDWTHVSSTGDTVLFYNSATGLAVRVILKQGVYFDDGESRLGKGWKVIAGGR